MQQPTLMIVRQMSLIIALYQLSVHFKVPETFPPRTPRLAATMTMEEKI